MPIISSGENIHSLHNQNATAVSQASAPAGSATAIFTN